MAIKIARYRVSLVCLWVWNQITLPSHGAVRKIYPSLTISMQDLPKKTGEFWVKLCIRFKVNEIIMNAKFYPKIYKCFWEISKKNHGWAIFLTALIPNVTSYLKTDRVCIAIANQNVSLHTSNRWKLKFFFKYRVFFILILFKFYMST